MDLDSIDDFSRTFVDLLFAEYPEWRVLAANERREGKQDCALIVVHPAAEADLIGTLWISTDDSEVTVGLDNYHEHFNPWNIDPPPDGSCEWNECLAALDFIRRIITEEVAIVSVVSRGMCAGAWCETRTDAAAMTVETLTARIGKSVWAPLPDGRSTDTVRVRSWRGTLNRDLSLVAQ